MNIAKRQREENAVLWQAVQEGIDDQRYYETDKELKTLTIKEVKNRLTVIRNKYDIGDKWDKFDEARWQRLAWRARKLGFNNPFALAKSGEAN